MKQLYKTIVIIYNPNSTGDSEANAKNLALQLKKEANYKPILEATKRAGHAKELAAQYSKKAGKTLIVSSSGDGGYNEVVNGILESGSKTVTTCVLPSGNANDHHHAINDTTVYKRIIGQKEILIDALHVQATLNGRKWGRYAHSYAGVGLTAYIGKKLTEATLNAINEKLIVLKYLVLFKHVTLYVDGKKRRYSSVVFGSIDRMSKVLKLTGARSISDGSMEVYELRERSTFRLFTALLFGSAKGFEPTQRTQSFTFSTIKPVDIQLDGEVITLDGNNEIVVSCTKKVLRTLA